MDFPLGEDHLHQLIEEVEEDTGGEGEPLIKETPAGPQGADGSRGRIPEFLVGRQEKTTRKLWSALNLKDRRNLSPGAIGIVDRFHAKPPLSDLAKVIFTSDTGIKEWTHRRYEERDEGRRDDRLKAIGSFAFRFLEAKRGVSSFGYLVRVHPVTGL